MSTVTRASLAIRLSKTVAVLVNLPAKPLFPASD
jgi:hypothetical protein